MAPSPAAGTKSAAAAPKTPTKLSRRSLGSGATPQTSSARKPVPPQVTPNKPAASSVSKPKAAPAITEDDDDDDDEAEHKGQSIEMKDDEEDAEEDDDEDDGPLSKVHAAKSGAAGGKNLESAAPEPIADDDEDQHEQHDDDEKPLQQLEGVAEDDDDDEEDDEDDDDDATEKIGGAAESADDNATDELYAQAKGQQSSGGKQKGGLLSGAKDLAGKAGGLAGKTAKDPKKGLSEAPGDVAEGAQGAAEGAKDGVEGVASKAKDGVEKTASDPKQGLEDTAEGARETVEDTAGDVKETAEDGVDEAQKVAGETTDEAGDAINGVKDQAEDAGGDIELPDAPEGLPLDLKVLDGLEVNEDGYAYNAEGTAVGRLTEGDAEDLAGYPINHEGEILDDDGDLVGRVELVPDEIGRQLRALQEDGEELPEGADDYLGQLDRARGTATDAAEDVADEATSRLPGVSILEGLTCGVDGLIYDDDGNTVGKVVDGDPEELQHAKLNEQGEFVDEDGNVVGRAEIHEDAEELVEQGIYVPASEAVEEAEDAAEDATEQAEDAAEDAQDAAEEAQDGAEEVAEGAAEEAGEQAGEIEDQLPGIEALEGKSLDEAGEIRDDEGNVLGAIEDEELKQQIAEGEIDPASLTVDAEGNVLDAEGNVLGQVAVAKQDADDAAGDAAESLPLDLRILSGKKINKKGQILDDDGEPIGELADGELKDCTGKKVNEQGEVLDKQGNVVGHVRVVPGEAAETATRELLEELGELPEQVEESAEDAAEDAEEQADEAVEEVEEQADEPQMEEPEISILDGLKVNKKGQVLNEDGEPIGELTAGELSQCAGKKINAVGEVLDKDGNVIGHVRTLPVEVEGPGVSVLEGLKVNKKGQVLNEDGEPVGELTAGETSQCAGKKINNKGEVLDQDGNVIGSVRTLPAEGEEAEAESEEQQPEEEQEGDQLPPLSVLEGLAVNKSGKLVDDNGTIVGELVEGDAKKLSKSGITADSEGQFWDNKGHVIGRAQTVPVEDAEEEAPFAGLKGLKVVEDGWVQDEAGHTVGYVTEGDAKKLLGRAVDEDGDILDKKGSVVGHAERYSEEEAEEEAPADLSFLQGKTVTKTGLVIGDDGVPVARLVDGNPKELTGKQLDESGQFWNDKGKVIGRVELIPEEEREQKPEGPFAGLNDLRVIEGGKIADEDGNVVGNIVEGNPKRLVGLAVDEDGDIIDKYGNVKGHAEPLPEEEEPEATDYSILDGLTLNKQGFLVDGNGTPFGKLVDGNAAELAGRQSDENGQIFNDKGKVVGQCEPLPEEERIARPEGPFAGLQGLRVVKEGKVEDEDGNVVGEVVEGNAKRLIGLAVDEDGDIIDKFGNTKGHAERLEEEDEVPVDNSLLAGKALNKQGYVVDEKGIPFGRLIEGNVAELAGRKCDENGYIHGDTGKIVGRCEILPENERVARPEGPFAGLEGLRVVKGGMVEDSDGNTVGEIVEGNAKRLVGLHVDEDGDIIDKYGNVKGHAEPWEEEEQAPVDLSRLSGTKINKAGFAVDGSGQVIGRVVEGNVGHMVGKKVDGEGQIWDDAGNVIGRCELVTGIDQQEGPFAGFDGLQINKDGTITTPAGDIVGRVVEGDIKKLLGHTVDEDGDINDKNGNTIGRAERWEPEEKERRANPMSGRRVNKEGEVRDDNGDLMGKLTMGDLGHCVGQEIDDAGNVVDVDGNKIGEVTLIENIDEETYEGPTEEELAEAAKREEEREIAAKMGSICQQTLERMQPICKQITDHMEKADRTPKDELDEEELVNQVKPLIEEGGRILQECNGSLRGLDPDGKIAAQAKGRAGTGEATPEEYRLAETLKELTTTVVTCIDNAKKKLNDMPHAKKKLNPLWALMTQPLFQILAAVGLLLAGVLGLVGQLLNGLGLGGLVNGLLGGLGINKLLQSFGLTSGDKGKKGSNKSALSSLPIVGGFLGGKK